jgi:hypothetical protein
MNRGFFFPSFPMTVPSFGGWFVTYLKCEAVKVALAFSFVTATTALSQMPEQHQRSSAIPGF